MIWFDHQVGWNKRSCSLAIIQHRLTSRGCWWRSPAVHGWQTVFWGIFSSKIHGGSFKFIKCFAVYRISYFILLQFAWEYSFIKKLTCRKYSWVNVLFNMQSKVWKLGNSWSLIVADSFKWRWCTLGYLVQMKHLVSNGMQVQKISKCRMFCMVTVLKLSYFNKWLRVRHHYSCLMIVLPYVMLTVFICSCQTCIPGLNAVILFSKLFFKKAVVLFLSSST